MKKIGKISINPEKVIKNEELVNLKGGTYGGLGNCGWDGNGGEFDIACGWDLESVMKLVDNLGGGWCCETATSWCEACGQ